MQIRITSTNKIKDVFVIYWPESEPAHFYVMRDDLKSGFDVEVESETCSVHNGSLDGFLFRGGQDEIVASLTHRTLIADNLQDQILDYALDVHIYEDPLAELNRRLKEIYYDKNNHCHKYLPIDAVRRDDEFPVASDQSDGFYFCPVCFEANEPFHDYDEAIRCENCGTLFNIK